MQKAHQQWSKSVLTFSQKPEIFPHLLTFGILPVFIKLSGVSSVFLFTGISISL